MGAAKGAFVSFALCKYHMLCPQVVTVHDVSQALCGMVRVLCNYPTLPLSLDVKVGESIGMTHLVL